MLRRAVAALVLLLLLTGFSTVGAGTNPKDPYNLTPVINAFRFDGVSVTVEWWECGQVNAFYYHSAQTVVLCEELKAYDPGVIRYILAHELSHATIMQLDLPYTSHHEGAADELAALMLIWIGRSGDVLDGANFWAALGRDENPEDDHYGDWRRAWNLTCLVVGSEDHTLVLKDCTYKYRHAVRSWIRLLQLK